ncbi:MAG: S-layer homology domain-containing protein [Clostridia bacterium]|nr:S-layer homology domain-containing protein [Clostridia bacterium]
MKKTVSVLLILIITVSAFVSAIPAYAAKIEFSDVMKDMWSYDSIVYAVSEGYMQGVGGGKFDPEGSLTRGMVATVLWRREGSPAPKAASGFSDVKAGQWYADVVAWAKEAEVVKGITDKTFEPDGLITREQLATMLFRYSSTAPVSVPERADLEPFADDGKVSDWATEALEWAAQAGLIKGTDGNRLDPGGFATREQFAAIVERYDYSFKVSYRRPVVRSSYTKPVYSLVTDADFYVSTTGSDENDGDFDHPFASFEKAVEAVRALDKTGRSGITVAFKAGDYGALSISLTGEDSGTEECPVTYCAYGDGDVVFNDGFDVSASEFVPITEEEKTLFPARAADNIKKADISDRLTSYDPRTQLVMNDEGPRFLARFPNVNSDGTDDLIIGAGFTPDKDHIRITTRLLKNKIDKYHNVYDIILYGYLTTGWYKDTLETAGYTVDPESGGYDFLIPHPETSRAGHLRFLELDGFDSAFWNKTALVGISEELDSPTEYWIDGESKVMYACDPSSDYHFTAGDAPMITMNGAAYINFSGLTFKNSNSKEIEGMYCSHISLYLCDFSRCAAESAVSIDRSDNVTATNCEFSLCAGEALYIAGMKPDVGGRKYYIDNGVRIENNRFTLTGLTIGNTAAVNVGRMSGAAVSHNEFKDCLWGGVCFSGASNTTVEYNVFDRMMWNGDDFGAVYNWGYFDSNGNVIRYNLLFDIRGGTNGRMAVYHDGTIGNEVYGNIFWNCDLPVVNNYVSTCNVFRDNIVITTDEGFGGGFVVYNTDTTVLTEEAIASDDVGSLTGNDIYQTWVSIFKGYDELPDAKAALTANEHWREIFEKTTDLSRVSDHEFCLYNSLTETGNRIISPTGAVQEFSDLLKKHSKIEDNVGIKTDENPFFINPSIGDYRMRDGIDFPFIPFDQIGRK